MTMIFLREAWSDARPAVIKITTDLIIVLSKITKDFLLAASLYLGVFLFHTFADLLRLGGFAAKFFLALHSATAVCSLVIFAYLFIVDIYSHRR